jgi:hypothetical protein
MQHSTASGQKVGYLSMGNFTWTNMTPHSACPASPAQLCTASVLMRRSPDPLGVVAFVSSTSPLVAVVVAVAVAVAVAASLVVARTGRPIHTTVVHRSTRPLWTSSHRASNRRCEVSSLVQSWHQHESEMTPALPSPWLWLERRCSSQIRVLRRPYPDVRVAASDHVGLLEGRV